MRGGTSTRFRSECTASTWTRRSSRSTAFATSPTGTSTSRAEAQRTEREPRRFPLIDRARGVQTAVRPLDPGLSERTFSRVDYGQMTTFCGLHPDADPVEGL